MVGPIVLNGKIFANQSTTYEIIYKQSTELIIKQYHSNFQPKKEKTVEEINRHKPLPLAPTHKMC